MLVAGPFDDPEVGFGLQQAVLEEVAAQKRGLAALVLVSDTDEVRAVLERVYGLLGLPFRPESIGDLPADLSQMIHALSEEVRGRYEAERGRIGKRTMDRARSLRDEWRVIPDKGSSL